MFVTTKATKEPGSGNKKQEQNQTKCKPGGHEAHGAQCEEDQRKKQKGKSEIDREQRGKHRLKNKRDTEQMKEKSAQKSEREKDKDRK